MRLAFALLLPLALALAPAASADWVLYRYADNEWKPGERFTNKTVCETNAHALAQKLVLWTSCVPTELPPAANPTPAPPPVSGPTTDTSWRAGFTPEVQAAADAAEFQQAAKECAKRARVRINHKPGTEVTILGTATQNFDFDACMTKKGHSTERSR